MHLALVCSRMCVAFHGSALQAKLYAVDFSHRIMAAFGRFFSAVNQFHESRVPVLRFDHIWTSRDG